MLFLIEPPKRAHVPPVRSGQNLLDLANVEEDGFDEDYNRLELSGMLERWLIGKSNSADYSERWKRDFSERPTWCDADMSLQQIKRKNARGNKAALYSRSFIQRCLYQLGCYVQRHSFRVIFLVLCLFFLCCYGLQFVRIETDIVKLWVSEGGRLHDELNYFTHVQNLYRNHSWTPDDDAKFIPEESDEKLFQRPEDEAGNTGYQVLIQTNEHPSENLLTEAGLLRHVQLLQEIVDLQVEKYGINWTLSDICFKPGGLDMDDGSFFYGFKFVLERLIPCIWITPIDCFYEGSKPLGPSPPIDISRIQMVIQTLGVDLPNNISWQSMNPQVLIKGISDIFDIGTVKDFFKRTGIGAGYLDRPCVNPLDPSCPTLAPNYYDSCKAMEIFEQHLSVSNLSLSEVLTPEFEEKAEDDIFSGLANLFGLGGDSSSSSKKVYKREFSPAVSKLIMTTNTLSSTEKLTSEDKPKECKTYRNSFLKWISDNKEKAQLLFGPHMPKYPNYGNVMSHGCQGFARSVLNWPTDMILGGVRNQNGTLHAEALQSVILVSTPTDVYNRLKNTDQIRQLVEEDKASGQFVNATSKWSPNMAETIVSAWQRRFTESIYKHEFNFKNDSEGGVIEKRTVHPLASTSISDMLEEFCDFNYAIIFVGYFLMLCYAIYSQVRFDGWCLLSANSSMGLACAGVFTVTFASIAGLGLSTWLGIEFNAATTQIVPFLTLGIGVDNMFLLLHNYPQVTKSVKKHEIGVLMKETGMSILMTSLNNILSFLAGTILPIPALRSFCAQSSILLTFNLIAILTVYPAIISLDLRRKKSGRRDLCCCLVSDDAIDNPSYESYSYGFDLGTPAEIIREKQQYHGLISRGKEEDEEDDAVQPYTLRAFLRNYYVPFISQPCTKFIVLCVCIGLFIAGFAGIQNSTQGLDLSDVLPENTAPSAFLKARDKYFSFYPMFMVLRGEDIDFAKNQHLIENLRRDIGKSRFVVKLENGEPSERYWLGLFKEFLFGLQQKIDEAQKQGLLDDFDKKNKSTSNELKIAYSMICSYGNTYDCSRVGRERLIDESGTINPEGFYNYLYAWHEYESMFYRVSQASFYPRMHKLRQGPSTNKFRYFIPPAPKPMYSQIPFYLTGLTDTTVIVEMIKEIREISQNYTKMGLDNYPNGVAFTFWEQYLDLNTNLFKAISMIAFAVFIVISLLLFNPWAASCIMIILLMMTVELAGFLGWYGIKLNPVSAVTLITAVGIGVEFTAHVVFAFLTSLGTRNERMAACIDRVFVPVIHGALSTLLGILMLGFSEFEFVQKYFFIVMSALIIIGLINGLVLLPVLLSLIGPNCEIRPRRGRKHLPVPPPLSKNNRDKTLPKVLFICPSKS